MAHAAASGVQSAGLSFERAGLRGIAALPRQNRANGQGHRIRTRLLFLKLIQCARGIIEAARSDLKKRQSEKGAFAGRIAFHGVTKRLERLVRPAQSVQRDSVIVPYPRILGIDFQCPFVLLPGFLKPVERQQHVAAMMQRGHVPGSNAILRSMSL